MRWLVITLLATLVAISMIYAGEVLVNLGEDTIGFMEIDNITKFPADKNYKTSRKPLIPIKLAVESIGGEKTR